MSKRVGCSLNYILTAPQDLPVPKLLSGPEIEERLKRLSGWRRYGRFISKVFKFETFMDGIDFIERVAEVAEREEHHPDIHIRYATVRLSIQTHSEGGVTRWDFDLAKSVERMLTHSAN